MRTAVRIGWRGVPRLSARLRISDSGASRFFAMSLLRAFSGEDVHRFGAVLERPALRTSHQPVKADQESGECLPGARGCGHQNVPARGDRLPAFCLRVCRLSELSFEPLPPQGVELAPVDHSDTPRPRGIVTQQTGRSGHSSGNGLPGGPAEGSLHGRSRQAGSGRRRVSHATALAPCRSLGTRRPWDGPGSNGRSGSRPPIAHSVGSR